MTREPCSLLDDTRLLKRGRVYQLRPGDLVVLETAQKVGEAQMARYADVATRAFAPAKVVVLDGGMTVRVLRPVARTGDANGDAVPHDLA